MDIPTVNHHVGSTERVFVAHVNDLNDFYLHSELVRDSLLKLGQDLYNEYSDSLTNTSTNTNEILNVGDYCACPSESEDWYRGLIRQIDSNGIAIVFKIDYGDVQPIPLQFLRPLHSHFNQLHRLAFHCSLANLIKPLDGWPSTVIDEFRSRLTTTFLYAKFINYNEMRDILEVEITEKNFKTSLNNDFQQYQPQRLILPMNDRFLYKTIPLEQLDCNQSNQIRLLYYISPSHFYVYLRDKMTSYTALQTDLQKAVHNLPIISSAAKYQVVAVQDNHAIWHRAVILDSNADLRRVAVYYLDIGQREYVSINNIHALPQEFQYKQAMAIPCRLLNICPIDSRDPSKWQADDQVHDEFNRLMVNNVSCKASRKQDQIIYDIEVDIPKIGDLGIFLSEKNFVSRQQMNHSRSNFPPGTQSFVRAQLNSAGLTGLKQQSPRGGQPNEPFYNINAAAQQPQTRMFPTRLPSTYMPPPPSSTTMTSFSSSTIGNVVPPQEGLYTITQVHSAAEFYGVSEKREHDLDALSKHLEAFYNSSINDPSLNTGSFKEDALYVVQQGEKYYRVSAKSRDSDTRVSVKLIDRGDDIIVDKSELLTLDAKSSSIAAFAEPFRLRGCDESQNIPNITRTLKKLILNQRVHITQIGHCINGYYTVDVISLENQYINRLLFPDEKVLSSPPSFSNNRTSFNQSQQPIIGTKIFNNSTRNQPMINQDATRHLAMSQRTNDTVPTSPNTLAGASRTQPGRFMVTTTVSPSKAGASPTKENMPRLTQRTIQEIPESTPSTSAWNREPMNKANFSNNSTPNQVPFTRQQSGSSNFGNNQRTEPMPTSQNRFSSTQHDNQQGSFDQRRPFASGSSRDENNFRRGGANSNRGSGFSDREGRGGFHDRHTNRSNDNNNSNDYNAHSSGGFSRRGGGFHDRNNDHHGNNMQRSQNSNNNNNNSRGGFQNRRGQGDYGRRGDRGASRGGTGFNNYRSNFQDRDGTDLQLSSDFDSSQKSFGSFKITREVPDHFQAGDQFLEQEIPKDTFQFVISHIQTPNDFCIQLLSKGTELSNLTETLQNEYDQAPQVELSLFKVNQPCLAKSANDNCWYRAVVLLTGLNKLKIRFVDFGDSAEANSKTIRLLAKKHCAAAPYAYKCSLENVDVLDNVNIENLINQCASKTFNGKIKIKTADQRFSLESDDFLKLLLNLNAIRLKPKLTLKRTSCAIVHIESSQHQFFVQDDLDTVDKISALIEAEEPNAPTLTIDEVEQLPPNTIVIAMFEDEPYRAIIQSEEPDDNVSVCYVDFGNSDSCLKTSLKRCSEELSSYPYQSKCCHFYGIAPDKVDEVFKHLESISDSENVEFSIVKQKDHVYDVILYANDICVNEKFGCDLNSIQTIDIDNQLTTTATTTTTATVQTQPLPAVAEQPIDNIVIPLNESTEITNSEDIQPKIEDISNVTLESSPKYLQGLLTHVEQTKPYIYIQLTPESELIMEQVNALIDQIVLENPHNSSYKIGEYAIAKYSVDDGYYRARIESYTSSSNSYAVYFLDYGNTDEDVPLENLYPYSNELEKIEPQAHGYLLNNVSMEKWTNKLQQIMEDKLNYTIEFSFVDETNSVINVKFDHDDIDNDNDNDTEDVEQIQPSLSFTEQTKIFQANITAIDHDCFYVHTLPNDNLNIGELEEHLQTCNKQRKVIWSVNDLCMVCDDNDKFYRGKILSIDDDNKYNVKCIDYGNRFDNVKDDHLFVLPDTTLFQQLPLAHQCRLNGTDDGMQEKAIEEIIKNIPETECVTIHVENNLNDPCWFVRLVRENGEIVNDRYVFKDDNKVDQEVQQKSDNIEENEIILSNTSDSANIDEQKLSESNVTQDETNNQLMNVPIPIENDSIIVPSSDDQAIDVSTNDPSMTNVTKSDETNNSIVSN